jgi:hypothetical protein
MTSTSSDLNIFIAAPLCSDSLPSDKSDIHAWCKQFQVDHPLRGIRKLTDVVLASLSAQFDQLYMASGRPSIAPEYILRALLLQVFYSVRSERLLVEQIDCNLLFR